MGTHLRLPDALRPHATIFRLPPPTFDDYRIIVERMIREYSARMRVQVELTPELLDMVCQSYFLEDGQTGSTSAR